MKEILAKAGEIVVGDRNSIITAKALGSSLGICLYDSYDRCGGFVECLLPKCTKDERSCYVDVGIQQLYDQVTSISESHQPLIAKLIGGASLFQGKNQQHEDDIGHRNIKMAYDVLMQLHIPVVAADVGDTFGRTLHFHLDDVNVYIETKRDFIYHI